MQRKWHKAAHVPSFAGLIGKAHLGSAQYGGMIL